MRSHALLFSLRNYIPLYSTYSSKNEGKAFGLEVILIKPRERWHKFFF